MNIVIFGAPLSGKGTHTRFIQNRFDMDIVSTGDLLRKHMKNQTDLGKRIAPVINAGGLIDVNDVMDVIEEAYHETSPEKGVIFDGAPRRVEEFFKLMAILQSEGETIDKMIVLDVPEEELFARMYKRREKTIAAGNEPRSDDNESVLADRLEKYRSETYPVIDAARYLGIEVIVVNGNNDIKVVQEQIANAVSHHVYDLAYDFIP